MIQNLRTKKIDDQMYVNVSDLLRLMVDVMNVDGMHPHAIQAIDGLGVGLALRLNVISLEDIPGGVKKILEEGIEDDRR